MKLKDMVAVVTGAASPHGLGFAIARKLGAHQARVIITDIRDEVLARADDLRKEGIDCLGAAHDVTVQSDWQQILGDALHRWGQLDILVNNAAIVIEAPVDQMAAADFRAQLDVNLTGTFLGCSLAIPLMRRGGGGSIVNISSVAGLVGYPALAGYNASKGGIRLLTKGIAVECAADGIRCNSIHPGMIWTDIMQISADFLVESGQSEPQNVKDELRSRIPLGQFGEPEDVANAVLFLASNDARFITGSELVVDGGMTAGG